MRDPDRSWTCPLEAHLSTSRPISISTLVVFRAPRRSLSLRSSALANHDPPHRVRADLRSRPRAISSWLICSAWMRRTSPTFSYAVRRAAPWRRLPPRLRIPARPARRRISRSNSSKYWRANRIARPVAWSMSTPRSTTKPTPPFGHVTYPGGRHQLG